MSAINISTGSRLHFGLLCGDEQTGWKFGGIGMMIDSPGWKISLVAGDGPTTEISADTPAKRRISDVLKKLSESVPQPTQMVIRVDEQIPFHQGLGSGTQLAIAVATAVLMLNGNGRPSSSLPLSESICRATRSAIGTIGFDQGGFLVDHGKPPEDGVRKIDRLRFPDQWRVVVIGRRSVEGLSGVAEEDVFRCQRPMTDQQVSTQAKLLTDELIPALRQAEFAAFRDALEKYGAMVGEYFSPRQGSVFADPVMREVAAQLRQDGIPGAVQSSWGPAICIPVESQTAGDELRSFLQQHQKRAELRVWVARPLNAPARITSVAPERCDQRFLA